MQNLSVNAQKLYSILLQTNGAWENNLLDIMFEKPAYIPGNAEAQTNYWQWEANAYGTAQERPVAGNFVKFIPNDDFSAKLSAAYQELKKAGKANEKNSGFNTYFIYPIK